MNMASLGSNDKAGGHFSQASLLGSPSAAAEGIPLFQEALDRISDACVPRFEKIAGEDMTVTCSLTSLTEEAAGDIIAAVDPALMTALFEMPVIGSRLLVTLDDDFLQLVIELMCGGICGEPAPTEPRPGTSIDRQFARVVFNLLCTTIERECVGFGLGSIIFGQIETKLDPAALGKRSRASVATFAIACLGRRASFRVAFPQVVVSRFKQDTLPDVKKEAAIDPEWTERFQAEIGRTVVSLDAFLDADKLTLGEVATLKVGQIIPLPKAAPSRCELRCDQKLLFRCELGQAEGRYSLRIEESLPRKPTPDTAKAESPPFFNFT